MFAFGIRNQARTGLDLTHAQRPGASAREDGEAEKALGGRAVPARTASGNQRKHGRIGRDDERAFSQHAGAVIRVAQFLVAKETRDSVAVDRHQLARAAIIAGQHRPCGWAQLHQTTPAEAQGGEQALGLVGLRGRPVPGGRRTHAITGARA